MRPRIVGIIIPIVKLPILWITGIAEMFPVVIRIFGLLMRKVDVSAVTMISVIMVQQVRITVKVPCQVTTITRTGMVTVL